MIIFNVRRLLACAIVSLAMIPVAQAQWAVIDVPAIAQLIQQVQTLQQQVTIARDQLQQAKQSLESMTGPRGMDQLLRGAVRNYLPANWDQVTGALQGQVGAYSALAREVQSAIKANAVLPDSRLALMSAAGRQQIQSQRQWSAMQQALSHEALSANSSRFTSLQRLIDAIPAATDQKAILELQARISAEQSMLQTEQIKLQALQQASAAEDAVTRERLTEQAIAADGRFETRFQPTP
jgi:type IV secretion system protein VirB5